MIRFDIVLIWLVWYEEGMLKEERRKKQTYSHNLRLCFVGKKIKYSFYFAMENCSGNLAGERHARVLHTLLDFHLAWPFQSTDKIIVPLWHLSNKQAHFFLLCVQMWTPISVRMLLLTIRQYKWDFLSPMMTRP